MKKNTLSFTDFDKLDIRVGDVKEASNVEGSKKLIRLLVDLGEDYGVVEILTGLAEYYQPQDFIGNKYAFLANLEPKKMAGAVSNGMVLVADTPERPIIFPLDKNLKTGTVIR